MLEINQHLRVEPGKRKYALEVLSASGIYVGVHISPADAARLVDDLTAWMMRGYRPAGE